MHVSLYCDGAARGNPGPAAFGFVVKDQAGKTIISGQGFLGKKTNNEAEYQAVIEGLRKIAEIYKDQDRRDFFVDVRLDSQLVVEQLNGHFRIKEARMRNFLFEVRELEGNFSGVSYHWIPRHENKEADSLANRVLDLR